MKKILPFFFLFLLYVPVESFAWGTEGHRVAGEIASRHLSRKASAAIAAILGKENIAVASNWADFIKSDSAYRYLDKWHYIDLPDSLSEQQVASYLAQDTATDAFTKIKFLSKQLRNKSLPNDQKKFYLKLLIHLVEDVHQPLHTIDRGRGGNDIKVTWFNAPSNLHSVWDSELIQFQQFSYTEYANMLDTVSAAQIRSWQHEDVENWINQSYTIGEKLVNEILQPNQKLTYRYNFDHIDTLNNQLLKAGIHLAAVLNEVFG